MSNIVITGAGKGLGKAISERFGKEGSNFYLCSRTQSDLDSLESELMKLNSNNKVTKIICDISTASGVDFIFNTISEITDRVDLLINNAGVFLPGEISDPDCNNLEQQMNTNFWSAYRLTRLLLPAMKSSRTGTIINMCSIASLDAYPGGSHYCISKFALYGFSKCLRQELIPYNIRVISVLPGATWSNSWSGVELPEERLMRAEDVAEVIYTAYSLSNNAVMEEVILRPQLGDL